MTIRQTETADQIRRTDAGAIDVQYYVAKGNRLRNEAYWRATRLGSRRIGAGLRGLVRAGEIGTVLKMRESG
jgi:hypothetical protein